MYVFNSDTQHSTALNFPVLSRLGQSADGPITINGLAAALSGAMTADFRLTVFTGSKLPTGSELDLHANLLDGGGLICGGDYIDDGGMLFVEDAVFTGTGDTADGLMLRVEINEPGDDNGCVSALLEVDAGSGFVPVLSLPGVTYVDGYGVNPVSHDGTGDLNYYTISDSPPPPNPSFWTDLIQCVEQP